MQRLLVAAAAAAALAASGCGGRTPDELAIAVRYSRFTPELVTARAGVPVTITLENGDPIEHEWIVGTPAVHDRHRTGAEPHHDSVPTEVTIAPGASKVTIVTFDAPGEYRFVCHLPGHEAYGMRGTIRVR